MPHSSIQYKTEQVRVKRVYYAGSDTLLPGYAMCYDRDNATAKDHEDTTLAATSASWARHTHVVKPATDNVHNFAGIVANRLEGPGWLTLWVPEAGGTVLEVYTDLSCTAEVLGAQNGTSLFVDPGQYELTDTDTGAYQVGFAIQTVDRSGTSGLVQAVIYPIGGLPTIESI